MLRLCTQRPEGVESFRCHGCFTTWYALTRGGGIFKMSWMLYDFVRIDQRGWDLLDFPGCYDFVRVDQRGGIF